MKRAIKLSILFKTRDYKSEPQIWNLTDVMKFNDILSLSQVE